MGAEVVGDGADGECFCAVLGGEAVEAGGFHLVLTDWNMPEMNGIDFLRALRREPGGDRPTVVFCTTENDMSHIAEAMRSGANEYIMKPFDSEIIESKFSEVGLV